MYAVDDFFPERPPKKTAHRLADNRRFAREWTLIIPNPPPMFQEHSAPQVANKCLQMSLPRRHTRGTLRGIPSHTMGVWDTASTWRVVPSHSNWGLRMRRSVLSVLAGAVGALLVSNSALAHHGAEAIYEKKEMTLKATITEFVWTNPHIEIGIDTVGSNDTVDHWLVEAGSPANNVNRGWTKKSIKPGDAVTITFRPGLRGVKIGRLLNIVTADGKELKGG